MIQLVSVEGNTLMLLYHAAEQVIRVGDSFTVMSLPAKQQGLVAQVICTEFLRYDGLQAEAIQRALEARVGQVEVALDGEEGMAEIEGLMLATATIRKGIEGSRWQSWDGWTPTRQVEVLPVATEELLARALPVPRTPLLSFVQFGDIPLELDGERLNMINVITGKKNSGKSHLAKWLALSLAEKSVPIIIFDVNGEYTGLPKAQALRWGEDFFPRLLDVGWEMLRQIVKSLYPLNPGSPSESVFESRLPTIFNMARPKREDSPVDIPFLRRQTWGGGEYVERAIDSRLEMIGNLHLFWESGMAEDITLEARYDLAIAGAPLVFDMRRLSAGFQMAFVRAMNHQIERLCDLEARSGRGAWPFVFYEEAHGYCTPATMTNIISRCRHFGIASVFVTNSPDLLDPSIFRQVDSLFVLALTNKDDLRTVGRAALVDQATLDAFVGRMPEHHCLIVGNVTQYPLMVKVDKLPSNMPPSGRTRSTWDRFQNDAVQFEGMHQ